MLLEFMLQTRSVITKFGVLQLVPAVTELIIAELLYLQYKDRTKPIFLYINSTGTSRADGETVSIALLWFCPCQMCLSCVCGFTAGGL